MNWPQQFIVALMKAALITYALTGCSTPYLPANFMGGYSDGERLVFQLVGGDQFAHRIAEQPGVVPVVEAPFKLIQVGVQMLRAHVMESPDNGSLEQAPYVLDTVGVDFAADVLAFGIVHGSMPRVVVGDAVRVQTPWALGSCVSGRFRSPRPPSSSLTKEIDMDIKVLGTIVKSCYAGLRPVHAQLFVYDMLAER